MSGMAREEIEKHNRTLLHALQTSHQVAYNGKWRFIHTITFQTAGGSVAATVYLTGSSDPVAPELVSLAPEIT